MNSTTSRADIDGSESPRAGMRDVDFMKSAMFRSVLSLRKSFSISLCGIN
jgi:hypothetical protein